MSTSANRAGAMWACLIYSQTLLLASANNSATMGIQQMETTIWYVFPVTNPATSALTTGK
jgi:hypothetical protein